MQALSRKSINTWGYLIIGLVIFVTLPEPVDAADPLNGKSKYIQQCAMCHGKTGQPVMPGAADFSKNDGLLRSDQSLMTRIQEGGDTCPGYWGILKQKEILDVISFLRTLN